MFSSLVFLAQTAISKLKKEDEPNDIGTIIALLRHEASEIAKALVSLE